MTNQSQNNLTDQITQGPLTPAQLLRIEADGERDLLTPEQCRELDDLLAQGDNAARAECDRHLRGACARVMAGSAPAGLADRIALAMNETELTEVPSRVEALAPQTRNQGFWRRIAPLATAAMLTLVAGIMIFQSGPRTSADAFDRAAGFVADEHDHCEIDIDHATHKLSVVDSTRLPTEFSKIVGQDVALSDLLFTGAENVTFESGGECHVPGGKSMHLRFTLPDGDHASLFVQKDQNMLELDPGVTYKAMSKEPVGPAVFVWDRSGLTYYLVTNRDMDCSKLRDCIRAPQKLVEVDRPI